MVISISRARRGRKTVSIRTNDFRPYWKLSFEILAMFRSLNYELKMLDLINDLMKNVFFNIFFVISCKPFYSTNHSASLNFYTITHNTI